MAASEIVLPILIFFTHAGILPLAVRAIVCCRENILTAPHDAAHSQLLADDSDFF